MIISIALTCSPFPHGVVAYAMLVKERGVSVEINTQPVSVLEHGAVVTASSNSSVVAKDVVGVVNAMSVDDPEWEVDVSHWIQSFSTMGLLTDASLLTDHKRLHPILSDINSQLYFKTYLAGFKPTRADALLWGILRSCPSFLSAVKANRTPLTHLHRYYLHLNSLLWTHAAVKYHYDEQQKAKEPRIDQGSFDIGLQDAKVGEVVTRFPPEPSGYLHIGHAKAALLNQYFAELYKGKLIVRFDDTNPSKEKVEFEESIKEDLHLIGVHGDVITHTSDWFEKIHQLAIFLIKKGLAYADDTDQATMRDERMHGRPSRHRDASVEDNLKRFAYMTTGTEEGQRWCLRAKISVDDPNKALRDPVIYRCNMIPHPRTGDRWKVYPTYDFACPIVDSLEGVTHALRTNEYRDRNPQYEWFLKALELRWVHIWDYSRMNFVYTLLSKRKLQWFVDNGKVSGWDDPRFPTVRGIRRRGLTIEGLKKYILMQGASQRTILLEWDKLWALNKAIIDPVAPRHTGLDVKDLCKVTLSGAPEVPEVKEVPKHKKNPAIGMKKIVLSNEILLDQADAITVEVNEEVTLMDWGNVIIRSIHRNEQGVVTSIDAEVHLEGDFKKTKKKLTWLAHCPGRDLIPATLHDYDYLITKKKLEEDDTIEDCLTPVTEFKTEVLCDANVSELKKGDIIQLERRGYFIVDAPCPHLELISVPDGRVSSIRSKAATHPTEPTKGTASASTKIPTGGQEKSKGMYAVECVYGDIALPHAEEVSKMYPANAFY